MPVTLFAKGRLGANLVSDFWRGRLSFGVLRPRSGLDHDLDLCGFDTKNGGDLHPYRGELVQFPDNFRIDIK